MDCIVVLGSVNADLVTRSLRLPNIGETVSGSEFAIYPGGKGANQAVGAARLGAKTCFMGAIGEDDFGSLLENSLKGSGVDVAALERHPGASGVAVINIDEQGNNRIVVVPGANGQITSDYIDTHRETFLQAKILMLQLEVPIESVCYASFLAKDAGITVMLDPAPVQELSPELLAAVTWLTPNQSEACRLSHRQEIVLTSVEAVAFAADLLALGSENVLLKLGGSGLALATRSGIRHYLPAFSVPVVDTTAAGDALNAGFAVALSRGLEPVDAALFASAVAALSVTRAGAQPSMPTLDEVCNFIAHQPVPVPLTR